MAIARGAGTEIIRSVLLEAVANSAKPVIFGVAHHVYTVLSIICQAQAVNADNNWIKAWLLGYDTVSGTTGRTCNIFQQDMSQYETYVWNDKFSFNGNEPTDFTATLDSIAKQDAIADQAQATAQKLHVAGEHASDNFDVLCTYLDQNNA